MSNLILPQKWTRQPQTPVGIDWSNPLTRGLCLGNTASLFNNAVDGAPPTRKTISVSNKAETVYSHANGEIVFSAPGIRAFVGRYLFDPTNARFGGMFSSTNRSGIYFEYTSSQLKAVVFNNGAWSTTNIGSTPATGALITLAVVSDSNTSHRVYRDGVLVATLTNTAQVSTFNVAGAMYCDASTFYTAAVNGVVGFAGFTSTPSNTEIKSLSDNPWQIFKSQSRRIFVASAGGGVSLSLTGQSLTANLGALSASVTSSVTGNQTTLQQGTITANVSQTLTGQAISLVQGSVSSDVSTVITGQTVSLAQGSVTDASSGNVTKALSGQSLSVSQGALTASISLALNGQSIVLSGGSVSPAISSALAGQQSSVQQGTISANISAGLTGQAVVLSNGTVAQAGSDVTKALTGQQLSIALGVLLEKKTIARPSSDTTLGAWLPSAGSSLYATLDEVSPDDADYIYTNSVSTCKIALNAVADPLTSSGQVVSYRVWSPNSNGLTVRLMQGATEIASWTHTVLPTSPTTYQQALTAGQCDAITDYSTLAIQLESV